MLNRENVDRVSLFHFYLHRGGYLIYLTLSSLKITKNLKSALG